jgi:UDP-2,4-diacetamido-2,4,6-trideoxy-beta-L-altropyranose hydrolase
MDGNVLLLRADADTRQGTGHVMRCLALAQAWQDAGGRAALVGDVGGLAARLAAEGIPNEPVGATPGGTEDATRTAAAARRLGADWVVLDGYHFTATFQAALKDARLRVLALDDCGHAGPYHADVVLNQNLGAPEDGYHDRARYTRLLLGPRYALLRREFWPWRTWQRPAAGVVRKVLVTLGGADAANVTTRVLDSLRLLDGADLEVRVVVGAANPHAEALEAAAAAASPVPVRLLRQVTDMAELLRWADVAVTAGGSTCWELAFLGLPAVVLVVADNQRPVAEGLAGAGAAVNLGWFADIEPRRLADELARLLTSAPLRDQMSRCGQTLVDGWGGARVVRHLQGGAVALRRALPEDCRRVWRWSNDPAVRAVSFSPEPIPWERHVAWFADRLADPRCHFFIGTDAAGERIGQVRCELTGDEAVISVSLGAAFRGHGHGRDLIWAASEELFRTSGATCIHAYVKEGNVASVRAFLRAGYQGAAGESVRGQPAEHLVLRKAER